MLGKLYYVCKNNSFTLFPYLWLKSVSFKIYLHIDGNYWLQNVCKTSLKCPRLWLSCGHLEAGWSVTKIATVISVSRSEIKDSADVHELQESMLNAVGGPSYFKSINMPPSSDKEQTCNARPDCRESCEHH